MKAIDLPKTIPVFPLSGVIFFPNTNLPLNIFEPRYLALVSDCMKSNKYMGMIQAKHNTSDVYSVGCLGKITEHKTTNDGRLLINLVGVTRFQIKSELNNNKLYREFIVDYEKFSDDLKKVNEEIKSFDEVSELYKKTKIFFKKNGLLLNWNEFEKLDENQRINTLAMIAPISNEEKQTILESVQLKTKTKTLSEIINFYLHDQTENKATLQ
ncbi:MAG: LON peptidase substrate-binding domain-containing protein [Pelagibacteraceae bacterium]|jgi:Lon protease-like protein